MGSMKLMKTHINSFKNNHGRVLQGPKYWIIGIFERETKKINLLISRLRNRDIINDFV